MFLKNYKTVILIIILSIILFLSGLVFFLYLQFIFPALVPHHGGGERFTLSGNQGLLISNALTAHTGLHLSLQTNDTITLFVNNEHICKCTHYTLTIEPGEFVLVMLRSESPTR